MATGTEEASLQSAWNSIEAAFGHSEYNIKVWGTVLVSFLAYWSLGTFFTIIDVTGRPKFILSYKVQENFKSYPASLSLWGISGFP